MGWATDDIGLRRATVATIAERYRKADRFPTRYWTPEVHVAAFALPRFIAETAADRSTAKPRPARVAARPAAAFEPIRPAAVRPRRRN